MAQTESVRILLTTHTFLVRRLVAQITLVFSPYMTYIGIVVMSYFYLLAGVQAGFVTFLFLLLRELYCLSSRGWRHLTLTTLALPSLLHFLLF